MKKNENAKKLELPKVTIDDSLDKYKDKVIFTATLQKAKEALRIPLPKTLKKENEVV